MHEYGWSDWLLIVSTVTTSHAGNVLVYGGLGFALSRMLPMVREARTLA